MPVDLARVVGNRSMYSNSQSLITLEVDAAFVGKTVLVEPIDKYDGVVGRSICVVQK